MTLTLGLLLGGCASTSSQEQLSQQLTALQTDINALQTELADTKNSLATRHAAAQSADASLAEGVAGLGTRLDQLPGELSKACPTAAPVKAAQRCEPKVVVRTVTVNSDKLVVGELERVRIDPPGGSIVARIDTGAGASSVHADQIVEFERDGKRWVRFDVKLDNGVTTLERPIKRFVRVVQQADPEGARRPVIDLRVRLGNVRENVDFTLADRSHMDNEMLLGRNFLTDVALVDVGRQFVQPPVNDDAKADKEH